MNGDSNHRGTIAITGSNGFIGGSLAGYFAAKGWRVLALQRHTNAEIRTPVEFHRFSLPNDMPEQAIAEADMLVHCAYQPYSRKNRDADSVNETGTRKLLDTCRKHGVKMVFLSTMSAHESALSHYGKCKLALEKLFDPSLDLVLKLGLVIGKRGGIFMRIADAMRRLKFIPLVDGGKQPIQTLTVSDLCEIIGRAYEEDISGEFILAERDSMRMKELYDLISRKLRLSPVYISVPFGLIYTALNALGLLGIESSFTTENLLGLKQLRAFDTNDAAEVFGVELMGTAASIDRMLD